MDVPDSLTERLELFRSSGRFFKHGAAELFAEESWVQVLLGQGLEAQPDPVSQFVSDEELVGFLNDIAEVNHEVADSMPDHGAFVASLPTSSATHQALRREPRPSIWRQFTDRKRRSCPERHSQPKQCVCGCPQD